MATFNLDQIWKIVAPPARTPPTTVTSATTAGSETDAVAKPAFSGSSEAAALEDAPFDAEPVGDGADELTPVSCELEPKP